ncbi:hypothetical protein [Methyloversatilis sp.]|uniref:hypothetical protein n=1 Tax=Methyloversatilis sp. TaxID=2569862 RepID=UPI003D277E7B
MTEAMKEQKTAARKAAQEAADRKAAEEAEAARLEAEAEARKGGDTRIEDAPEIETIRMVRDEPMHPRGPTDADVHPDEVENWVAAGWRVE